MFRSIRSILLTWYAAILLAAVVALGAGVYVMMKRSTLGMVDVELRAHAQALAGAIEGERDGGFELEISDEYQRYFAQEGSGAPYFVIWDGRGQSTASRPGVAGPPPREGRGPWRTRGRHREIVLPAAGGVHVIVGRSIEREREILRRLIRTMGAIALVVLALALAGGWLLAGRALAPVRRISEAASAISASNLSRRIDVGRTESELGQLATTLNGTFDRLEAAFARQGRFTADASHELRTPLSVVMAQAELALKKERTPAEYRESLETCLRAAQRMKAVVEGLLTLARADTHELKLNKESLDLGAVVGETVSWLRPLAGERKVALTVDGAMAPIVGDRDRLREVVTNLVGNAIRYNREGGRVDIRLRDGELTVADTGLGIPEADQPHIFERFYRVDKARSREQGGSGLGLAISKWIVEAHGGTISFVSREGEGTKFTVRFPASGPGQ